MAKLNWDRVNRENRVGGHRLQPLFIRCGRKKTRVRTEIMDSGLREVFESALRRTAGSPHYSAVWSMRRHYLVRGRLTEKQVCYVTRLAGGGL